MKNENNDELEDFIQDWFWDNRSHKLAQAIGSYLFRFIDEMQKTNIRNATIKKHLGNCWWIGKLECDYGYNKIFEPLKIFDSPSASHEYEFKRKCSDSDYALNSYRSTWRKLYKFTLSAKSITEKDKSVTVGIETTP